MTVLPPPDSQLPKPPEPAQDDGTNLKPAHRLAVSNGVFAAALTLVFFIFGIFNILHHPMWRDETRTWQVCAPCSTIPKLFADMRYEGVPLLWYLIVWCLTRLFRSMVAMQVFHVLLASGVVFAFACGPFRRWIKVLFSFGYFPFFEYATITRNYALIFLFLLLAIWSVSAPKPRLPLTAIFLFLLAQVSVWGAGIAGLVTCAAVMQWSLRPGSRQKIPLWKSLLVAVIVFAGCAFSYLEAQPGPGPSFLATWAAVGDANKAMVTFGTIWDGWVPLPKWTPHFWNTNLLDDELVLRCCGSALLLLIAVLCLLRRPVALFLLLGGVLGLMSFTYFRFLGTTRHDGHLFMILMAACWLARRSPQWVPPIAWLRAVTDWLEPRSGVLLGLLLAVNLVSGVGANIAGLMTPFSAARDVADYIRTNLPPDVNLAGADDYCVSPVAAYLGRDFYFPQMHRTAGYNTL
jgi:hypothetical protein